MRDHDPVMLAVGDQYKILQVDPEAEWEVIRAAYRALALKHHPDVSSGSQERMAALNDAWGILRDAASRADYDRVRAEAQRAPAVPTPEVSHPMPAPMPATPPGKPSGSILDFGRYAGWSLGQIAPADPEYLEWLTRTPIGRSFSREIEAILEARTTAQKAAAPIATAERRHRRFGRS